MPKPVLGPAAGAFTARLLVNSDNPTANGVSAPNSYVTITASLSNQQFKSVDPDEGAGAVMFGARRNTNSTAPQGLPVFATLSEAGASSNGHFSNTHDGRSIGIDRGANSGFRLFTSVQGFAVSKGVPTGDRIYMADLTFSFSSPVSDPYIHLAGLGSRIGALTFTTELEPATPGVSIERVAGSQMFDAAGGIIGTSLSQYTTDMCEALAGCGTVRLSGKNLTAVKFRVYVRGNGGSPVWGTAADHNGDEWVISISLPRVHDLAGSVFFDADGPDTLDGWEVGDAGGAPLYVNLIDPTDMSVIASSPVSETGMYAFGGLPGEGTDYSLELSTERGVVLGSAPPRMLPAGWDYVGEQLRLDVKPGNDGTHDGYLAATVTDFFYSEALFAIRTTEASMADIFGRVSLPDGRSAYGAMVELTDPVSGERYHSLTNQFGYYRFVGIPVGRIYQMMAMDRKRGLSASLDRLVLTSLTGVDIVLLPMGPPEKEPASHGLSPAENKKWNRSANELFY